MQQIANSHYRNWNNLRSELSSDTDYYFIFNEWLRDINSFLDDCVDFCYESDEIQRFADVKKHLISFEIIVFWLTHIDHDVFFDKISKIWAESLTFYDIKNILIVNLVYVSNQHHDLFSYLLKYFRKDIMDMYQILSESQLYRLVDEALIIDDLKSVLLYLYHIDGLPESSLDRSSFIDLYVRSLEKSIKEPMYFEAMLKADFSYFNNSSNRFFTLLNCLISVYSCKDDLFYQELRLVSVLPNHYDPIWLNTYELDKNDFDSWCALGFWNYTLLEQFCLLKNWYYASSTEKRSIVLSDIVIE